MNALLTTDELNVFTSEAVIDMSTFHWENYGKYPIFTGLLIYSAYIFFMIVYINAEFSER